MKIGLKLTKLDPPNMSPAPSSPLTPYRLGHSWRIRWHVWPFGALYQGPTRFQSKSSPISSSSRSRSFEEGRPWLWGAYISQKWPCILGENWVLGPSSPLTSILLWQHALMSYWVLCSFWINSSPLYRFACSRSHIFSIIYNYDIIYCFVVTVWKIDQVLQGISSIYN